MKSNTTTLGSPFSAQFLLILSFLLTTIVFICSAGASPLLISFPSSFKSPVKARLVSDRDSVAPGEKFFLGVEFSLDPGWHIYWRNPGDSGLPTRLAFDLPAGMQAGDTQWPLPEKFSQAGDIVGYGYSHKTVLMQEVVIDPQFAAKQASGEAKVSWLACREVCIPGGTKLPVLLKVGHSKESSDAKSMASTRSLQPLDKRSLHLADMEVTIAPSGKARRITLRLSWHKAWESMSWYPDPGEDYEVSNVELSHKGRESRISFTLSYLGTSQVEHGQLRSVVDLRGANRLGIILPVDW